MNARILILVAILASAHGGCAVIERSTEPIDPYPNVSADKLRLANSKGLRIWRVFETREVALDSLPVGTMLSHYNPVDLSLPENWKYCNGDIVVDEDSPLVGKRLPNLGDGRFAMFSTKGFGRRGGSNIIVADGQHDHGGRTLPPATNGEIKQIGKDADTGVRMNEQNHRHPISADGLHDHGGDKTPQWFGVLCIIKIK